ncbi:MAG TPA: 2-succinyl-5-enolpyruvyl-6-hydroxy-3-cyclohexene-1-carboxylic-acid synthase [Acidimicrobiaceae bacterium]|nr:2-succinyl-5-enolpyruvyl-6-hydroxy-3-cyclohexene-1-carboxylic-acid synthase [Acidimicrobiaceae bacterium]
MTQVPNVAVTFCATLVDQWVENGCQFAVMSPGSRSTPMALALAADERIRLLVHYDERSASFLALGLAVAHRRPVVVLTTSGTAASELHSAVVEAHQQAVPLLVVTADRPPELQGVWAPQTIDQRNLYGPAVRWFVEPGPPSQDSRSEWRVLANEAYSRAIGAPGEPPGPVHLNLGFREPLHGEAGELPPRLATAVASKASSTPKPAGPDNDIEQVLLIAHLCTAKRVLVVAGQRTTQTPAERDALIELCGRLNWPVIADHLSGCRLDTAPVIQFADPLLRVDQLAQRLVPEVVLHLGGLVASRVVNEWLTSSGASHIGIDRFGMIPDPYSVIEHRVDVAPPLFLKQCLEQCGAGELQPASAEWLQQWVEANGEAGAAIRSGAVGEIAVMRTVIENLPTDGAMFVSSSMPVRDLEWFAPARPDVVFASNRGANGIDGIVSTAVGVAVGHGSSGTIAVVGDLAFLHDTNGLAGLSSSGANLAVVVNDNDGGAIFSMLAQAAALEPSRFELLFGTPHGVDLAALCAAHRVPSVSVETPEQVGVALMKWRQTGGVVVVIVASSRDANLKDHHYVNAQVRARLEVWLNDQALQRDEQSRTGAGLRRG